MKPKTPARCRTRLPLGLRLHAYVDAELAHAAAELAWRGARRHEGVHLARRHLRRVRAVLALARQPLAELGETVHARVRRALHSLGPVRDAQAMLDTFDRLVEDTAPRVLPRRVALRSALQRDRDALMAGLLARDADFARLRRRLQAMREWLNDAPWQALRREHVDTALHRGERRLHKAAKRARRQGDAAARHRWRRRWRRLRQQAGALEAVGSRAGHAQHASAGRGSSVLGEEHDLHLLRNCLSDHALAASHRKAWHAALDAALRQRRDVMRELAR